MPLREIKDAQNYLTLLAMSTEHCAKLTAVGKVNNLDKVWITENQPLLLAKLP